jgi:addiction module RelB/DinJ family antitoxin
MEQITIAVDTNLRQQAENLFASLGTTISDVINDYLSIAVKENTIPLPATEKSKKSVKKAKTKDKDKKKKKAKKEKRPKTGPLAIRGCLRGKVFMADDFDDPIEGFEDYM